MKRFVIKLFALVVPVAVAFLIMNALYERTNYWKSKDYANKYTDAPYEIELAGFGSSIPCYALKFDVAPEVKAWNFSNVTEVYIWTYRVLKNYINHLAKGAVAVFELPYAEIDHRPESFRERYYRVLPKEDMDTWSFKEWLAYSKFPFLTAGKDKMRIFKDISREEMSPYHDRYDADGEQRLKEFAENAYEGVSDEDDKDEEAYQKNFSDLCKLIDLCYEYGAVPVIVSYPVSDYVTKTYARDPTFFDRFYGFVKELQQKYPDLVYMDYSHDNEFSNNNGYFKDAMHMNNAGAESFTRELILQLRTRGLLKE